MTVETLASHYGKLLKIPQDILPEFSVNRLARFLFNETGEKTLSPHAPEYQRLGLLRLRSDPVHTAPPHSGTAFRLRRDHSLLRFNFWH